MGKDFYPLEEDLGHLIALAHKLICQTGEQFLRRHGMQQLSYEQATLLLEVGNYDGVNQQTLATETLRDKGSVARLLDTLETKNLIVRISDRQDKRHKLIYLTHEGKQIIKQMSEICSNNFADFEAYMGTEELKVTKSILKKIHSYFANKILELEKQ